MATKRPVGINPLVSANPVDTIDHCKAVLFWLTSTHDTGGGTENDFGRSLVLETIRGAHTHVSWQLESQLRLVVDNTRPISNL